MKIIKIIQSQRNAKEDEIKDFIYRNLSQEMINGLEYDDPKTIDRALKMFGIEKPKEEEKAKQASAPKPGEPKTSTENDQKMQA